MVVDAIVCWRQEEKTQTNISCCDLTGELVWTPVSLLMPIRSDLSNFEQGMMVVAMWIKIPFLKLRVIFDIPQCSVSRTYHEYILEGITVRP